MIEGKNQRSEKKYVVSAYIEEKQESEERLPKLREQKELRGKEETRSS